jgi:uridine phosphorylase
VHDLEREGLPLEAALPTRVILCYQSSLLRRMVQRETIERVRRLPGGFYLLGDSNGPVGICGGFDIGAPVAAVVMEDPIAFGVRRFVSIGTAGSPQPDSPVGSIILGDRAIRDAGVSHPLPAARYLRVRVACAEA